MLYFNKMQEIVLEAGEIIRDNWYLSNDLISEKGEFNYVTQVDNEVQEYIISQLKELQPECNIISEEKEIKDADLNNTWVLDPLDGTTNYIHRYPYVAISLAYFYKNEILYGVVYNPINEELYTAEKGKGAYLNGKRIQVSNIKSLDKALIGTGFPYDRTKVGTVFEIAKVMFSNCQELRRTGSAALDMCNVSRGILDGYYESDLKLWDISAGWLIVEESGGAVDSLLCSINEEETNITIASNMYLKSEIVNVIKENI